MLNKKEGIVKKYNGYHGIILAGSREYLFFNHDIHDNQTINVNDIVEFIEVIHDNENGLTYNACFVKRKNKNT